MLTVTSRKMFRNLNVQVHVHDVIGDVEGKKERKKERKKDTQGNGKMKNESCLRWDSNPQHSVLQTDAPCTSRNIQSSFDQTNACSVATE